jgi:hypothetical protein
MPPAANVEAKLPWTVESAQPEALFAPWRRISKRFRKRLLISSYRSDRGCVRFV